MNGTRVNFCGMLGTVGGPTRVVETTGGPARPCEYSSEVLLDNGQTANVLNRRLRESTVVGRASFNYRPGDTPRDAFGETGPTGYLTDDVGGAEA